MTNSAFNIFINKKYINVADRGFNFGDGVFETILVKNKNPLYFSHHMARLKRGCGLLRLNIPSLKIFKMNALKAISNKRDCILKIYVTRGISDQGYSFEKDIVPNIYFRRIDSLPSVTKITGLKIAISSQKLLPNSFSSIKHMNRLDQSLFAHELNSLDKIDELLLTDNHNNVIETISSNIFFANIKGSNMKFYTPEIGASGIEGVMRRVVIDFLIKKKNKIIIKKMSKQDLSKYDICFITNSIKGIRLVRNIGKIKYQEPYSVLQYFERLIIK